MALHISKLATLAGHQDCLYTVCAADAPQHFFSAGGDGMVVRWDLARPDIGDLVARVPNSVYSLAYLPTEAALLVGQNYEGLHWIDVARKQELRSVKLTSQAIFDIQIYQEYAFLGFGDGVVAVFDWQSWATRKYLKASDKSARAIAIAPRRGEFAVAYSDGYFRVFDVQTLALKYQQAAHNNSVFTIQYTPDENYVLTGSRDAHLKIWDTACGYRLHQDIVAHLYAINHIAYHPQGTWFATASMDKSIKLWDAHTFALRKVIDRARHAGHGTSVNKLYWSGYNDLLVSASDDRMLSVWQIQPA